MGLCRFLVFLVVLVEKEALISATSVVIPQGDTHSQQCLEELGIKNLNSYETEEIKYNSTCYTKCIYEKDGKLGADGLIVTSKFPPESLDALTECQNAIKAKDICRKINILEACMIRKTDSSWEKYKECDKFINYGDGPEDITSHCYKRCQMIVDGILDKDGKVKPILYESNPNNTITQEEASAMCVKIVNDENACAHDLNMQACINYVIFQWSSERLKGEFECAEKYNIYPFYGVQNFDAPRSCYDRCILIKSGELDEHDIKKSEFFRKIKMSETKIEEAYNTCKMTMQETDKCTKDLFFYDCVSYVHYAAPVFLKKQKECAFETKTPLVDYRQKFTSKDCYTRCMMIKDEQLDSNGMVNRTNLRQLTFNDTIINEAVEECSALNKNHTCLEDTNAYFCAFEKVNEMINKLCEGEIKNREIGDNGFCYNRCLLVHSRQLSEDGEVVIDPFKDIIKNITIIESAIKTCKTRFLDEDKCTRIINQYNCVNTEVWNQGMDGNNSVYPYNK